MGFNKYVLQFAEEPNVYRTYEACGHSGTLICREIHFGCEERQMDPTGWQFHHTCCQGLRTMVKRLRQELPGKVGVLLWTVNTSSTKTQAFEASDML